MLCMNWEVYHQINYFEMIIHKVNMITKITIISFSFA